MFETNLRDERFLPFEGAGAISTWKLDLPADFRGVRLHDDLRRDPARPLHRAAGRRARSATQAATELKTPLATAGRRVGAAVLAALRLSRPSGPRSSTATRLTFTLTLRKDYFPYRVQRAQTLTIDKVDLYDATLAHSTLGADAWKGDINSGPSVLTVPVGDPVLTRTATQVFLIVRYSFKG